MNCLLYWNVIMFALYKGIGSQVNCDDTIEVDVAAGEKLTLTLERSGIKATSWTYKGKHLATTKPDEPIDVKNRKLGPRLSSKPDGSLIISHIISDDQGVYTADVLGKEEKYDFTQCYDVRVHKKLSLANIEINHRVTRNETCTVTLTCTVNGSDVTPFWINSSAEDFNANGNILIVYKSDPNATFSCMAANTVSNVSRTAAPWRYCQEGESEIQSRAAEKSSSFAFIFIFAVVIILICFVLYWRKKPMKSPEGTKDAEKAVQVNTVYDVVRKEGNEEMPEDGHHTKDAQKFHFTFLPKA
ncbi:SLAM family member 9 [Xenopus tropicalis]|uniref:SLAM family member 9 n=1 Tax=Xenopus tropicalis TaxID=8364 RepID=A0A8J0QV78_XENTR|nr:SLAM family member 9 [Xenopus tropicalis]|eukprot:XP_002938988.3 PREDICTED: SLAM family member 9-like [Xenopus tropicalis]